uniref:NADH-ubiquinone oxidoreductase chain 4 n=1 Tax=Didemnum vexillum TaxID=516032 RepID=A0A0A7LFL7_9ASCI|nr:NADH dehydrogenase subunit 4 [Didemnum vexillum]AIZ58126.1 NADH dehydrogenase subunit 4 [Didemnum vexillum]UYK51630.1 NADH dehydrogenase subunit 4 [Didemnum vexillum]
MFFFFFNYYMFNYLFNYGEGMYNNQIGFMSFDITNKFLILITFLIFFGSYLSMMNAKYIFIFIMSMSCFLFSVNNFIIFFLMMEGVLIPMIFLFYYYGEYSKRYMSLTYMFIMTVIFGIPFFVMIITAMKMGVEKYEYFFFNMNSIFFFMLILGFLMKLPVYGLHFWLPKAHVDAPVGGSMILAGIMLKYGGYGLIRSVMCMEYMNLNFKILIFVFFIGSLGYLMMGFICMQILDMKVLIAFSSVGHMSFAMLGNLSNMFIGLKGSMLMYIGHGLISPLLFFFSFLLTLFMNTRLLNGLYGLGKKSMFKNIFLFTFLMNLGLPPFINFFSEIYIFSSLFMMLKILFIFLILGFLFNGVFHIKLITMIINKKKLLFMNKQILNIKGIYLFVLYIYYFFLFSLFLFYIY